MSIDIHVPKKEFLDTMHDEQRRIYKLHKEKAHRFFILNWHRRARKTSFLLNILIRACCAVRNQVFLYVAPTYKQAKSIIWTDPNMLQRWNIQEVVDKKNESELTIRYVTGSLLIIKGADDPDSIRGIDCAGVVLDEFSLQKVMIWEEILRPIITQNSDRWAFFAFTPKGQNHAYEYWKKAADWEGWHRSHLPVSSSMLLPDDELEKAKKQMPDNLYDQEFECSFVAEEDFTLITTKILEDLKQCHPYSGVKKRVLTCDPSTGGDECAIYIIENGRIESEHHMYERDTMKIAGYLNILAEKNKVNDICVDTIGIGRGIGDRLSEMGKNVHPIESAATKDIDDRFANLRAAMWWNAMELIRDRKIFEIHDYELMKQLNAVRYEVTSSSGKIKLEPKQKTKERLGRSPDRADAFVYGLWTLEHIDAYSEGHMYTYKRKTKSRGWMAA